jgi:hypothetical protein
VIGALPDCSTDSCGLCLASVHLMWYEHYGTGRISLDGRIPRTRKPSCGGPLNGQ